MTIMLFKTKDTKILKLMEERRFVPGDKVKLLTGGPDMTIREVHFDVFANKYRNDIYDCIWYEKSQDDKYKVHYSPYYNYELVRLQQAEPQDK